METCCLPDCEKPVKYKARGWCGAHHQHWLRHGDPLAPKSPPGRKARERPQVPCACGCGGTASGKTNRGRLGIYISGHNARVKHPMQGKAHTEETKAKLASYTGERGSSYKHGWSKTPTFVSWNAMHSRCRDKGNASYPAYGGRGIRVCEHWRDFVNFLQDMGERPSLDYSIDRIDADGGYWCGHCAECTASSRPANCRWLTRAEQNARRKDPGGWIKRRASGNAPAEPRPKVPGKGRTAPRVNECGHPERPHEAQGKCKACYLRDWREAKALSG